MKLKFPIYSNIIPLIFFQGDYIRIYRNVCAFDERNRLNTEFLRCWVDTLLY